MFTTYFLDLIVGNMMHASSAKPIPSSYYVGLSTVLPTDAAGTGFKEPTGGDYARSQIKAMSTPADGSSQNIEDIEFIEAMSNWGVIKAYGIFDTSGKGSGNLLMYDAVTPEQNIVTGNQARFKAGQLNVKITNAVKA